MNRPRAVRSARSALLACAVLLASFALGERSACAAEPSATDKPGADGWYDAAPPDGSFRVRGPLPFQSYAQHAKGKSNQDVLTQGVRASQPGAFDAVTKFLASCTIDPSDRRGDKARIEANFVKWAAQVEPAYRRPIEVGKFPGVEFQMGDPKKTLRVRIIAGPQRICTLFVQWNAYSKPSDADIDRFLGSFAFTNR